MHRVGTLRAIPTAMNGTPKLGGHRNTVQLLVYCCPPLLLVASILGCGAVGAGPSQPPSNITVAVTPSNATVLLGEQQTFVATVSNSTNSAVIWSVNGIPGGNAAVGTITAGGTYTAPANLPAPNSVSVTATSAEDTNKNSSARAIITSDVSVSVAPSTVSVELGTAQPFAAAVNSASNPNRSVTWILSGSGCTGVACGTVDSGGTYTAPGMIPTPASVNLIAISVADPSKIATATINVTSTFLLSVAGPASVNAGTSATYAATVTPAANSNPSRWISWSVAGVGCTGNSCGTITQGGVFTAPAIPPSPATARIIATPQADPTKAASISISILPIISVVVSPSSASVPLGNTQAFQAVVTGAVDTTVTWDVNGVVDGNVAVGSILNSQITPNSTMYSAPQFLPAGGFVTVRARSNTNPSFSASVTVTLTSAVTVDLNPTTSSVAIEERQSLHVQVNGTPNQIVSWLVNGIAGGNTVIGQICAAGSNPCQPVSISGAGSVDYIAPAGIPSPNPVTITATSQADTTKSRSASITILPHIVVSVQPGSASLAGMEPIRFTANVTGTVNQQVIWMIAGAACGIPGNCGSIDSAGLYTAPAVMPSPNLITIVATSSEDIGQTGTATVTITNGPAIFSLAPTSAYAGTTGGFTLLVTGNNLSATIPGPGSTILVSGSPRSSTCVSTTQCIASLGAADLQSAGNLTVQLQNPDGRLSNTQIFVVLAQGSGTGTIPLTPSAPTSAGNDIVVVELSTNGGSGASGNVSLNIAAIGAFSASTGSCTLAGSPVTIQRPVSGNGSGDLCVFSVSGLSASLSFTVSGPNTQDITVINREPLGLGIVHLTLLVPAAATPGPRTLFILNPNGDKAAGTGAIEVQ
jgi:hypothetical protein